MVMQIMLHFFDYCSGHVIWSPDGTSIVIVGRDPVMHIWDVRRNPPKKLLALRVHTDSIWCINWSFDSRYIVTGFCHGKLKIWNVHGGALECALEGHTTSVLCVAWSPNNCQLVSGSADAEVIIWDVPTRQALHKLRACATWIRSLTWLQNRIIAVCEKQDFCVWDADTGDWLELYSCRTGHYFTGDHTTYLVPKQEGFILAMTDDGSRWMYKLDNGCILVRNVITGTDEHMVDGLTCMVSTAQFNKHGTHILAAIQDNTVRVWSLESC